jgi:hypothetical protein
MAEEQVDALLLTTRFDESGLDASTTALLNSARDFVNRLSQVTAGTAPLNLDTDPFVRELRAAGGDVGEFFAGLQQGIIEGIQGFQRLGQAVPDVVPETIPGVATQTAPPPDLTAFNSQLQAARANALTADQAFRNMRQAAEQLATLPAPQINTTPAVNATQALLDRMGLVAREAANARAALAAPINLRILNSAELRTLSRGYEGAAFAAEQARARAEAFRQTMLQTGQATTRAAEGTRAWAAGLQAIQQQQGALGGAFTVTSQGANRVRAGLQAIAIQASGTSPAIGQIVSGLLLLGPGSAAVLGAAAGIAVLATAMNLLEKEATESRKATDDLIEQLRQAERARLPDFQQTGLQMAAVRDRITEAVARLNEMERLSAGSGNRAFFGPKLAEDIERLNTLTAQLRTLAGLQAEQQRTAEQGAGFTGLRDLAIQVAAFGQSESAARRLALAMDGSLDPAVRRATLALLDQLDALNRQQQGLANLEAVLGRFGPLTEIGFLDQTDQEITLRPVLDQAEVDALIDRVVAAGNAASLDAALVTELDRARAAGLALEEVLAGVGLRLVDIGNANVSGPLDDFEAMRDALDGVLDVADEVLDIAGSLGDIGSEARRAVGGVLGLVDSLGTLALANKAVEDAADAATRQQALLQQAAAQTSLALSALNLIGSFIGAAQTEGPMERAIRENIEALDRNTRAQSGEFAGVGGQQQVLEGFARALAGFESARGGDVASQSILFPGASTEEFQRQLALAGLSLEDVQRVADELIPGFELLDSRGRIVGASFEQLEAAMREAIQAQIGFANTFEDQARELELRSRLAGTAQDPLEQFRQQIAAAGAVGATVITDAFAGIDLANEAAVRDAARKLLEDFDKGLIDAQDLGGVSRDQLLDIISGAADYLDSFSDSVQRATLEMASVPAGFRQARLAAEAQIAGLGPSPALAVTPNIFPTNRPGDGASLPDLVNAVKQARGITIETLIVQGANTDNAEQLLDKLVEAAERRSASGDVNTFTVRRG